MQRGGVLWSADYLGAAKPHKSRLAAADVAEPGEQCQVEHKATASSSSSGKSNALVDPSQWPPDATTVMLRNIPNRYTQEDLLDELSSKGFHAAFDYFHLVMDMRTKRNKGFAFLNLRSPALALQIHSEFHGFHLHRYKSQKVLEVALAEVQGLQANAIAYLNTHGDRVQNVWFKPIIFVQAPGQTPDWAAVPLTESNLPDDIARVYGSHSSTRRVEQRQRALSSAFHGDCPPDGPGTAECHAEDAASDAEDPLGEGEYEEISCQVNAFLANCGANQSTEALLTALNKPRRRKRSGKKVNNSQWPVASGSSHGNHQGGNNIIAVNIADSLPATPHLKASGYNDGYQDGYHAAYLSSIAPMMAGSYAFGSPFAQTVGYAHGSQPVFSQMP